MYGFKAVNSNVTCSQETKICLLILNVTVYFLFNLHFWIGTEIHNEGVCVFRVSSAGIVALLSVHRIG